MVKSLTAYTFEIDDVESAVDELLQQLKLEENLLANSVGIINCFIDFVESGVLDAISKALPFDVVGCTSLAGAADSASGQLLLTLTVLTSDDVCFSSAASAPLEGDYSTVVETAYRQAADGLPAADPSLILSWSPLLDHVSGDEIVRVLDRASGGVPHFGTLSVGHSEDDLSQFWLFRNGEATHTSSVIVLAQGEIRPSFYVASISPDRVLNQKAIITGVSGKALTEVNNRPVVQFLQAAGLYSGNDLLHSMTTPLIIDYNDGTIPVARSIYALTPDGHALCGGDVPVNGTLAIGTMDYEDVMKTTDGILERMLADHRSNGAYILSCASRFLVLGTKFADEMGKVSDTLDGKLPYLLQYSGGEICPVYNDSGRLVNRFHNCTIAACVF